MTHEELKEMLEQYPVYKKDLFIRGFLITDRCLKDMDGFPFYGNWRVEKRGPYYFMAHELTGMYMYTRQDGRVFFIIGHAYDPFLMEYDEKKILAGIAKAYGSDEYLKRINSLTGVFVYGTVHGDTIDFLIDPAGMQSACWGKESKNFYISSHPQLIGDICNLEMSDIAQRLTQYKWYGRVMGPYLPADLTPFSGVKRIVQNTVYSFDRSLRQLSHKRFWPLEKTEPAGSEEEYQEIITAAADILKKNMELVVKKWGKPWISLTGGIDSNTTFAAARGQYDKIETFSYISAEKEVIDAEAAKVISSHFGVKHHIYHIPDDNAAVQDYDIIYEILMHNNGYIAPLKENEARKRMVLRREAGCDVEIKSWVSENIRAYWYYHFGRKTMPGMSAKLFRNLYKIFITDRKLAHEIDVLFRKYIREYEYDLIPDAFTPAEMHFNEVTQGSWGGLRISEMKYCFDITTIYNNRAFFDLMFRVPLEKRISSEHHLSMKKYLNPELYDMGIRVINMKETKTRAFLLNALFTVNMLLPF